MRRCWTLADLVSVLAFVAIGRSVHTGTLSIAGMATTSWPFLAGLAAGWAAVAFGQVMPDRVRSGSTVAVVTVLVGMSLRVVSGQGTAFAFVLVALAFLGASMTGWRLALAIWRRGASPPPVRED